MEPGYSARRGRRGCTLASRKGPGVMFDDCATPRSTRAGAPGQAAVLRQAGGEGAADVRAGRMGRVPHAGAWGVGEEEGCQVGHRVTGARGGAAWDGLGSLERRARALPFWAAVAATGRALESGHAPGSPGGGVRQPTTAQARGLSRR